MKHPLPHSYWVTRDRLLAGEYPCSLRAADARARLFTLLDAGVRSFVDLTSTEDPLAPYETIVTDLARERGVEIRYRRMAIPDRGIPSVEQMREILDYIDDEITAKRAVYVHCWGGVGRTGTVVGCWMVEKSGLSADDAIARIAELRKTTPGRGMMSPQTGEQCDFVARWCDMVRANRAR